MKSIYLTISTFSLILTGCISGDKSKASSSETTAKISINNKTEHPIYQLYIKKSNDNSYGHDMIPDIDYISATSKSAFETSKCDIRVDIKATGRFGDPKWYFEDQYLPCNKTTEFTITY